MDDYLPDKEYKYSPIKHAKNVVDVNNSKILNRQDLQERLQAELDIASEIRDSMKDMYLTAEKRVKELQAQILQNSSKINTISDASDKLYKVSFDDDNSNNNTNSISGSGETKYKKSKSGSTKKKSGKKPKRVTIKQSTRKKKY
jgi:hypothetical protein